MNPGHQGGLAVRVFGWFLRILPPQFRQEFGREMLGLFQDRLAEAESGPARLQVVLRGLGDVVHQGVAARWSDEVRPVLSASLGALGSDARLSLRRLTKDPTTSIAAVVSLSLAIGACTAAFRLVDGLLLRPLPVEAPSELYTLAYRTTVPNMPAEGWDSGPYVMFQTMAAAVEPDAEVFTVSRTYRASVLLEGSEHLERAYVQRISGTTFPTLGLQPVLGRLFTPQDDRVPGQHPVAVLSSSYWERRFGGGSGVLGTSIRIGDVAFEVVGVVEGPFSGVETGRATDVFIPTMMGRNVLSPFQNGLVGYLRANAAADPALLQDRLRQAWLTFQEERTAAIEAWTPDFRARFLAETEVRLLSASAGSSALQREFRRPLVALSALVFLVLLIATTNVANLLLLRARRRRVDTAVRVSIGAGHGRLVQLALVESALITVAATALGLVLSSWAVPAVLETLGGAGDPVRLLLPLDLRLALFTIGLAAAVTSLFGVIPAWQATRIQPIAAIKADSARGGSRRTPLALLSVQAGFCFLVLFVAGLFSTTARGLLNVSTGFRSDRVLALDVQARPAASPGAWTAMAEDLSAAPGVERVALAGWPLLDGSSTNDAIAFSGAEPDRDVLTEFLCVSEGWIDVMDVRLLDGRDLRSDDRYPDVALVNEAFVRTYASGAPAVGRTFERAGVFGDRTPSRIVGVVADVRYRNLRTSPPPTAYIPCATAEADGSTADIGFASLMVRTRPGDTGALVPELRELVAKAGTGFALVNSRTQESINRRHTVRERLLASLGGFFAMVALVLASVGLYGVLHDSVRQRQRELSVRIALGAPGSRIVREVTLRSFLWLGLGLLAGLAMAAPSYRLVKSLLFESTRLSPTAVLIPTLIVLLAGVAAAVPGITRALRTDPAQALRAE